MMAWGMVFGVVFANFGASDGPVNLELALADAIPDPLEAHVKCLKPFVLDGVICKPNRCGVIDLHISGGLGMSEFFKCRTDWYGVHGVWKSGAEFGFRR